MKIIFSSLSCSYVLLLDQWHVSGIWYFLVFFFHRFDQPQSLFALLSSFQIWIFRAQQMLWTTRKQWAKSTEQKDGNMNPSATILLPHYLVSAFSYMKGNSSVVDVALFILIEFILLIRYWYLI